MIRILLISDTHGNLDIINRLVVKTKADLVIHAGDFGFYDETSYEFLSARELFLLIKHSPKGGNFAVDKQTDKNELIEIVEKHRLLGDFTDYQQNEKQFMAPVYAVYGNHEDVNVIKKFKKEKSIPNLNLLDEENIYQIFDHQEAAFRIFGLGGNFLVNRELLNLPIAGTGGKVFATLHQFGVLYQKLEKKRQPSIFVSHVSPGKEPLLTRLIIHYMPDYWISGHMGAPSACVWNQKTIRTMDESLRWFDSQLEKLDELSINQLTPEAKIAYDLMKKKIDRDEYWYQDLWNVNLPDAHDGYALLIYHEGRFHVE